MTKFGEHQQKLFGKSWHRPETVPSVLHRHRPETTITGQ